MKKYGYTGLTAVLILCLSFFQPADFDKTVYQFTLKSIDGPLVQLKQYEGKVLVIVNTASKCGLTPQYAELEELYQQYKDEGLVVLGFPANDFAQQEPGTNGDIKEFCEKNYGVSFPMFSKIHVKGEMIHPLYQFLTERSRNGQVDAPVSWNFQKFLINKEGEVVAAIEPRTSVTDKAVQKQITKLLEEEIEE